MVNWGEEDVDNWGDDVANEVGIMIVAAGDESSTGFVASGKLEANFEDSVDEKTMPVESVIDVVTATSGRSLILQLSVFEADATKAVVLFKP